MNNIKLLEYTYKHRKIMLYLAKKHFNDTKVIERIKKHDLDKMYLMLFYNKSEIKKFHRTYSTHHDNDIPKEELDYIEMVLDWESARYTKDDKPLNAYDTLCQYYSHLEDNILPILKKVNLDHVTKNKDQDVVFYAKTLDNTTIRDIKQDLIEYIENL